MSYEVPATSATPALIVYLLDMSGSMTQPLGERRRLDVVIEAYLQTIKQLLYRSTKGAVVAARYRIACLAYSDHVYDLLDGVKTVKEVALLGTPPLEPLHRTETARAFVQAEKLLEAELPNVQHCPAPVICHLTDGEFTGDDPEPIVRRIMGMHIPDGNVLVENIFISPQVLREPVDDVRNWPGILPDTPLATPYAEKLRAMSSPLPEAYRGMLLESGYGLETGALMMLPGTAPELVALGFQMSGSTAMSAPERPLPVANTAQRVTRTEPVAETPL